MRCRIIVVLIITGFAAISAAEGLEGTVDYLLDYVETSEVVFIRNGRPHTALEAAEHMRKKYAHFKDDIQTPEDFIRLTATRSTMSGKPYTVKTADGKVLSSGRWLESALEAYRQKEKP